jgi:hypothetical protein
MGFLDYPEPEKAQSPNAAGTTCSASLFGFGEHCLRRIRKGGLRYLGMEFLRGSEWSGSDGGL